MVSSWQYWNAQQPFWGSWIFVMLLHFDQLGLNFNYINLTILQMEGLIVVNNLLKFQINSLQIEVRFIPQKFFRILKEIHNIEMCNRVLWVSWYHWYSTSTYLTYYIRDEKKYLSAMLKYGMALICAIWTHETKKKTGNMADKFFSAISTHSEGLPRKSILRISTFSSNFNIVWMKPYHSTRVCLPVFVNCDLIL